MTHLLVWEPCLISCCMQTWDWNQGNANYFHMKLHVSAMLYLHQVSVLIPARLRQSGTGKCQRTSQMSILSWDLPLITGNLSLHLLLLQHHLQPSGHMWYRNRLQIVLKKNLFEDVLKTLLHTRCNQEYFPRVFKTPTDVLKTACEPLQFSVLYEHQDCLRRTFYSLLARTFFLFSCCPPVLELSSFSSIPWLDMHPSYLYHGSSE